MAQDEDLLGVTNHGEMAPHFVLSFPISGAVMSLNYLQGEVQEQLLMGYLLLYGIPWNK